MHAQPPRTLKRLLKQYGQELIDDPRRTEALLRDHCGQHTREIFVLVNAQKQHVPNELLAAPAWMPRQATYTRLSRLLQTKLALTDDAADWAVASWAAALGLEGSGKGDAWSWLPGQARSTTGTGGKKSRSKKRQNASSGVQYSKKNARRAKARAARAELGWSLPLFNLARGIQKLRVPRTWANLLPWIALLTATVFLLTVVYWTSSSRSAGEVNITEDPAAGATPVAAIQTGAAEAPAQPTATPEPPLLDLPEPPGNYLARVMPLPVWANVDADEPLLIRSGPSTASEYITVLQDGDPVKVVAFSSDGRWSQIESPHAGWVSNDFLLFISEDAHSSVRLSVQQLQTRYDTKVSAAPLPNAAEIALLGRGQRVIVVASLGQPVLWYQIADPDVGWIAAGDLTAITP